jgi:hypothetical protein
MLYTMARQAIGTRTRPSGRYLGVHVPALFYRRMPRCMRFPGQQWPGFFVCVSPEATGIEGADARPTLAPLHPRHQYTPYLHKHAARPRHSPSFRKAQARDRQNQSAAPDLGGPPPHRQRPSGHGFICDTRRGSSIPRQQEIPKPESNIGRRRGCLG